MTIQPPERRPLGEAARWARGVLTLPRAFADRQLPPGAGETVMVVPGFLTGDGSTIAIRTFLSRLGYRATGWGLGRNTGNVRELVPQVAERVRSLAAEVRGPIKLVGWSLGGILVREATRECPEDVASIVTMGTPVIGGPKYTLAADYYRKRGIDLDAVEREVAAANEAPLAPPITAIYSRLDAVVAWEACIDDNPKNRVEHVEVRAGHAELGFSSEVFRVLARALR